MKSAFITRARHEAEMAAKDAEIADLEGHLVQTMARNAVFRRQLAKFDASNRRRDERGRYVGEKK